MPQLWKVSRAEDGANSTTWLEKMETNNACAHGRHCEEESVG
jgi:hypothetical protein